MDEHVRKMIKVAKKLVASRKANPPPQKPIQLSRQPKQRMFSDSEMLTPSEIERLRQEQNARLALLQKEFPKARIV